MPLNGYLQGVTHGLHTLGAIQSIKNENLRNDRAERAEARQQVIQGREDAAYGEANQISPFQPNPEHGPEVGNYLRAYGQNLGLIDKDGNIKAKDKVALHAALKGDENAQHDILQLQQRKLAGEISAMESSLGGRPNDDLTGLTGETSKQLQAKKEQLAKLNYTDKAWVAEQNAKRQKEKDETDKDYKEKALKVQEKQADKESLPTTPAGLRAYALKHNDPRFAKAAEETEAADLKEKQASLDREEKRYQRQMERWIKTNDLTTLDKEFADEKKALDEEIKVDENPEGNKAFNDARRKSLRTAYANARNKIIKGQGEEAPEKETKPAPAKEDRGTNLPPPKEGETYTGKSGKNYVFKGGKWNEATRGASRSF